MWTQQKMQFTKPISRVTVFLRTWQEDAILCLITWGGSPPTHNTPDGRSWKKSQISLNTPLTLPCAEIWILVKDMVLLFSLMVSKLFLAAAPLAPRPHPYSPPLSPPPNVKLDYYIKLTGNWISKVDSHLCWVHSWGLL